MNIFKCLYKAKSKMHKVRNLFWMFGNMCEFDRVQAAYNTLSNSCKWLPVSQATLETAMWLYSNFMIRSNEARDTSKRFMMVLSLLWNSCWGIYFVLFLCPCLFLKWLPLLFLLSYSSPSSCSLFFRQQAVSFVPSGFPESAKSFPCLLWPHYPTW